MIESFDYSKEKALEEIKALDLGVKDIEKNYEKSRANLEEEYSSVAVGSVVKKVICKGGKTLFSLFNQQA